MILVPSHEAPEVVEPGKETLDLPAAAVSAQLATVLRDVAAVRAVRGNPFDVSLGQSGLELVAVVRAVADPSRGRRFEESAVAAHVKERDVRLWRSTSNGTTQSMRVRPRDNGLSRTLSQGVPDANTLATPACAARR